MNTTTRPYPQELSAAQRARVRSRIRRQIAQAEEEAETSGELNLVPYLDILINTIIFMLATVAMATPLAHIKTSAPAQGPGPTVVAPNDMLLTVAIGRDGFYLAGAGGVVGDGQGPTLPCAKGACLSASRARRGGYDFDGLTRLVRQVKHKHPSQRKVTITADREIPYRVVVATIDALRGTQKAPLLDQVTFAAGVK